MSHLYWHRGKDKRMGKLRDEKQNGMGGGLEGLGDGDYAHFNLTIEEVIKSG